MAEIDPKLEHLSQAGDGMWEKLERLLERRRQPTFDDLLTEALKRQGMSRALSGRTGALAPSFHDLVGDVLKDAYRRGHEIPEEFEPFVKQRMPDIYPGMTFLRPKKPKAGPFAPTPPTSDAHAPSRNILDLKRPDHGLIGDGAPRREAEVEDERTLGIGGMPNVHRGALEDDEPRLPSPAWWHAT